MIDRTSNSPTATAALALESPPRAARAWKIAAWGGAVLAAACLAGLDARMGWLTVPDGLSLPLAQSSLVLLLAALVCEFADATVGMGYGTTLVPVLVILGYPIAMIVPAALLSQLVANVSAAFFHHRAGNLNFVRDRAARNVALALGLVGLAVSCATMYWAVGLPQQHLRVGVTSTVLAMGAFMLAAPRFRLRPGLGNLAALASVAAFCKAFSGGGYGPLVCGGQVLVGLPVRAAVAGTAVAEAIVCLGAVGSFYAAGGVVGLFMLLPLTVGAVLSTPASALTLRRLPEGVARRLMAVVIVSLSIFALIKGTT
jgi:uncharacterized membrane protein YfcA